jgi:hypothetical protein
MKRQTAGNIRVCLQALEEMCQRWPETGRKAIVLIQRLAIKWTVVWALPVHLSNGLSTVNTKQQQVDELVPVGAAPLDIASTDWAAFDLTKNLSDLDPLNYSGLFDLCDYSGLWNDWINIDQLD